MHVVPHVESIKSNARRAAAHLNASGAAPRNPFILGTEQHKEWARAYYEFNADGVPDISKLELMLSSVAVAS